MFKFDRQFMFFLFQNIFVGICAMIDVSFGNHINIDSICVLSAYTVINWVTYATYSIGSYAYRVVLDKSKTCFLISLFFSVLLGVVLYIFSPVVSHIYSLTDAQYLLFERCLRVHALSCPILAIREFLGNYAEYRCCNKHAIIGNVIFYSSMILTDALVIYFGGDLVNLLAFTAFCSALYSIYMFCVLDFRKEPFSFSWSDFRTCLNHGINTYINKITGKVATVVYNIYASRLGTELYSIHAVCYAVGIFTENFTNAMFTYTVVSSSNSRPGNEKFRYCVQVTKKYSWFVVAASYVTGYVLLIFTHGDVAITDCILYVALYSTEIFGLLIYTPTSAYLVAEGRTNYLRFGGMFGILIRIPITLIGYYLNLGLFPFAIACAVDFGIRGLYYYTACKRVRAEIKLCVSLV